MTISTRVILLSLLGFIIIPTILIAGGRDEEEGGGNSRPRISTVHIKSSNAEPSLALPGDTITVSFLSSVQLSSTIPTRVTIAGIETTAVLNQTTGGRDRENWACLNSDEREDAQDRRVQGSSDTPARTIPNPYRGLICYKAEVTLPASVSPGPASFTIANPTSVNGTTGTSVTRPSERDEAVLIMTEEPPSPFYCAWNKQFSQSKQFQGHLYLIDSRCPPTSLVSIFTIEQTSGTQTSTLTLRTTRNADIDDDRDCGFLGFSCDTDLEFDWTTTVSQQTGSLLPYLKLGDTVKLTWLCHPYQKLLWSESSHNWWGIFGDDDDLEVEHINISSSARGGGFSIPNGALNGSVTVNPTSTTNYSVTCVGSNTTSIPVLVKVDNPIGSITATPSSVAEGGSVRLSWSARNVEESTCSVTGPMGTVANSQGVPQASNRDSGSIFLFDQTSPVSFTLKCTRYNGAEVSWSTNVTVTGSNCPTTYNPSNPGLCAFDAGDDEVLRGGDATLTYFCGGSNPRYTIERSTNGGSSWTALPGRSNQRVPSSAAPWTVTANPLTDTIYRLTCRAGSNTTIGAARVTVNQPDLSSFRFEESNSSTYNAGLGDSATLRWNAENVNPNSCTASGGLIPSPVSGNSNSGLDLGVVTLLGTQTHMLTCQTPATQKGIETDPQYNPPRSTAVLQTGVGAPTLQIWSDTPRVQPGGTFTIEWSVNPANGVDADSCRVTSGGNTIGTGTSGSASQTITAQTVYTLTCTRNGEPLSASATIGILPVFQER